MLIIDDTKENLDAARKVFPNALYASNSQEALEIISKRKSDLGIVITDLCMEHPISGLEVIKESCLNGIMGYTLSTSGGTHNNGTMVDFRPYGGYIDKFNGKKNPETWQEVSNYLKNPTEIDLYLRDALKRIKNQKNTNSEIFDGYILFPVYVGSNNSIKELLKTHPNRDKALKFIKH